MAQFDEAGLNCRPRAGFCSILAKLGRGRPPSQSQFTIEHFARGRGKRCFQFQRNRFIRHKWKSKLPDAKKACNTWIRTFDGEIAA
jgi:hypothetical protein